MKKFVYKFEFTGLSIVALCGAIVFCGREEWRTAIAATALIPYDIATSALSQYYKYKRDKS